MTDRTSLPAILGLAMAGLFAALLVTWTWNQTAAQIGVNERNYQLRTLNEIVAPQRYDNSLFDDTIVVSDPDLLGSSDPVMVYRARKDGAAVAVILTVVAPRGYSGAIQLLVGINIDGTLAGVRVSQHHETAGLGDNIETSKSNWIRHFDQHSLGDPPAGSWAVKKDGGDFDQLTGATITPRAIVKAVRDALLYFEANRELLLSGNQGDTQP